VSAESSDIPDICEDDGRQHALAMYELLGHELCGITELRALGNSGPWVAYADNVTSFVDLAMERNRHGDHVYVGLQPRPAAVARGASHAWRPARGGSKGNVAKADDIAFVTNVAFDIDVATPTRRDDHPASNEELQACVEVSRRFSRTEGFAGTAAVALSGNGTYVINPIAPVEVDSGTASAVKAMERRWIAEAAPLPPGVRIDPIMDLPRIIRVIGTVNFKGTPARGRPHRRSRFLALPAIGGRQNLLTEQLRCMSASSRSTGSEMTHPGVEVMRGDLEQFETCEFVQWIGRDAPRIPEPAWMDFLTQCAWLEGGDGLAHRLSERDEQRYSHEETQGRLDRIRRAGYRPKRCQHLSGEDGIFRCPRIRDCSARRPLDLAVRRELRSGPRPQQETEPCHENL